MISNFQDLLQMDTVLQDRSIEHASSQFQDINRLVRKVGNHEANIELIDDCETFN